WDERGSATSAVAGWALSMVGTGRAGTMARVDAARGLGLSLVLVLVACGEEPRGVPGAGAAGGGGSTSASTGGGGEGGSLPEPVVGLYAEYFAGYLDEALAGVEA